MSVSKYVMKGKLLNKKYEPFVEEFKRHDDDRLLVVNTLNQLLEAWFQRAVGNFDAEVQAHFPAEYRLQIDTWQGVSNGADQPEQLESLKNHFENNKFQNMFINTPNVLAAILFAASGGLAFVTLYALIVTVLAAGFLGYRVFKAIGSYPARIQAAADDLNAVMNEIAEFRRYYEQERAKKGELLSTVEFL